MAWYMKIRGVYVARRTSGSEEEYVVYFHKLDIKGMPVGATEDRQGLSIRISNMLKEGSDVFSITCRGRLPS